MTCKTNYVKMGGDCISSNYFTATLTLTPSSSTGGSWYKSTDPNNTQLGNGLIRSNQILYFIAKKAGVTTSSCKLKKIEFGSIMPTVVVQVAQGVDPNTAFNNFVKTATASSTTTDDFGVAKVSGTTSVGSSDGPNLGLILGLTIPLVALGNSHLI